MLGRDAGKNRIIYIKALAVIRQLTQKMHLTENHKRHMCIKTSPKIIPETIS